MKKLLCAFMSLLLILSMFNVAVSATEETTLTTQEELTTFEATEPTTEEETTVEDTTNEPTTEESVPEEPSTDVEATEPSTDESTTSEPTTSEPVVDTSTYETKLALKAVVAGVSLEWECDGEADAYNVYRRKAGESADKLIATVTDKKYVDKTVENNTYYKYFIKSVVGDVVKGTSNEILTRYFEAPKNLKAVISTGIWGKQVDISWSAVEGATRYDIYYRTAGQNEYVKATSVSNKDTNAALYPVKSGYARYAVVAVCGVYVGALDTNGPVTKYLEKIKVDFDGGYLKENGISFSWSGVEAATAYRVYRRAGGEKYYTYLKTVNSNSNGSYSYIDTTVQSGKYYRYVVRAVYGTAYGPYDDNGQVIQYVTKPKLLGIANATDGVYVKWTSVAGASEYIIYRRGAGQPFQQYKRVKASDGNKFKDTSAIPRQYYCYSVVAVNAYRYETKYDTKGLTIQHMPLGTQWNQASIRKFAAHLLNNERDKIKGFDIKFWQNVDSYKTTGTNKQFVAEFDNAMKTEYYYANNPYVKTVTTSMEDYDDYYPGVPNLEHAKKFSMTSNSKYDIITVVYKDEANPEREETKGGISKTLNYVSFGGLLALFFWNGWLEYGESNTVYKDFTVVSTYTKDGKLVSRSYKCENVKAYLYAIFYGSAGSVTYTSQFDTYLNYTNFKY